MTASEPKLGFNRVYSVLDYYDGPRRGVADYEGKPHLYDCIFDESKDNYSVLFLLSPLSDETFRLAMEDWAIWQRWALAFDTGKTDKSTHPALPDESARHKELERILTELLVIDRARAVTRIGHFEAVGEVPLPKGVGRTLQVKWESPGALAGCD